MKNHFDIHIHGTVQGVFFRHTAKLRAQELGITGTARNDSDGGVYIEAEGEENTLQKFTAWCKVGSDLSHVEKVDISEGPLKNYSSFSVSN